MSKITKKPGIIALCVLLALIIAGAGGAAHLPGMVAAATPLPVAVGSVVVTGEGGEVTGRDPVTGAVRWRYTRDLPLCTVTVAWQKIVTVYQKSDNFLPADDPRAGGGCSEVTALWPASHRMGTAAMIASYRPVMIAPPCSSSTARPSRSGPTWRSRSGTTGPCWAT